MERDYSFAGHAKPNTARSWRGFVAHAYCGGGRHSATNTFFQTPLLEDPSFYSVKTMTWTVVKPSIYLIAATLPSLRPLIQRISKNVNYVSFFTRLQSYFFSTQRETDNIPLASMFGGLSVKSAKAKEEASSGASTVGFKRLEDSSNQQHLSSGGDKRGSKTLHTYRERYEHEGSEDKLW